MSLPPNRDIILEVDNQEVAFGTDWQTSDLIDSQGIGEILVTFATEDTVNFTVYIKQYDSSGHLVDVVQLTTVEVDFPSSFGEAPVFVAKGTVQLNSEKFWPMLYNFDTDTNLTFNASIRFAGRSAS